MPTSVASIVSAECRPRPSARCEPIEPRPMVSAAAGLHAPEVAIVRERAELTARRSPEHRDQRRLGQGRELADRAHVPRVQAPRGGRADAPHALDRQRVQEVELAIRGHGEQPVGLRRLRWRPSPGISSAQRPRSPATRLAHAPPRAAAPRSRRACPRSAPSRARRGRPRRSTALRRPARRPRTRRTSPGSPRCTRRSAARRRSRRGRGGAPAGRPSPCGCRTPSPRSSPPSTTPPPTITGRPRSRGSSRCSTDAKNASASACSTNICSLRY